MFKNNLKIAFRNIVKQKGYSFINISGLAIGMAVFVLIMLFVGSEFSYDRFNVNSGRIYRLTFENQQQPSMAPAVGKAIRENIPEVERVVRFKFRGNYLANYTPADGSSNPTTTVIRRFGWADDSLFDVFSFTFIMGNPETALNAPFSIVLTENLAKSLFGEVNPLGKTIKVNNSHDYTVTGIIRDEEYFHLKFDSFSSFVTLGEIIGESELSSYNSWNLQTYVMLPELHDRTEVAGKISAHFESIFSQMTDEKIAFELNPLNDLYFLGLGSGRNGNLQFVYMFIAVGFFILLLACINFINLTTARSNIRAKEIGIKKVVGSSRRKLIFQFLFESVLVSLLAFMLALLLLKLVLPVYNNIISGNLNLMLTGKLWIFPAYIMGAVFIGLLAGLYPAAYLSSFAPGAVLKGEITKGKKAAIFRKGLIIFQFSVSIILMIGTLVVFDQLEYVKNKNLGFKKEFIINFEFARNRAIRNNKENFKQRLLDYPEITNVTFSQGYPGRIYNNERFQHNDKSVGFAVFTIDPDYFDLYGLEIIEGRGFSKDIKTDEFRTCIMNEEAVRQFGLDDPVGTIFYREQYGTSSFPSNEIEVIGVVKDFNFESLHDPIRPLVFSWNSGWLWMGSVSISTEDIGSTVDKLKTVWNEFSPDFPFEYSFLDETFDSQYKSEERFGTLFGYFTGLAILIAVLGLFGLAAFTAEKRTKEIGIRKVLGASITSVIVLLSKEFSRWVIISNIIAWPAAWFIMDRWLQNFAYKTAISLQVFILSGITALTIALLTVSYQSLKAARSNPVDSLRSE